MDRNMLIAFLIASSSSFGVAQRSDPPSDESGSLSRLSAVRRNAWGDCMPDPYGRILLSGNLVFSQRHEQLSVPLQNLLAAYCGGVGYLPITSMQAYVQSNDGGSVYLSSFDNRGPRTNPQFIEPGQATYMTFSGLNYLGQNLAIVVTGNVMIQQIILYVDTVSNRYPYPRDPGPSYPPPHYPHPRDPGSGYPPPHYPHPRDPGSGYPPPHYPHPRDPGSGYPSPHYPYPSPGHDHDRDDDHPGGHHGGGRPGDNHGGGRPGDNHGGGRPGDNHSGGRPGDNHSGGRPGHNHGGGGHRGGR